MQSTSSEIWDKKYRLKDNDNNIIDEEMEDSFRRVAKALASVEKNPTKWEPLFLSAMLDGAIPAGRIMSNAGAGEHKPNASLINCTVHSILQDSIAGIYGDNGLAGAAKTLSSGCGIGYEFSTLRPAGAYVGGVGANTSGSLSFMDDFDSMCFNIASAGGRRGAQMGTFDISHPDVLSFIKAKREDGRLRQFNLSILITDAFMQAVENGDNWSFIFPVHKKKYKEDCAYVWKSIHYSEDYHVTNSEEEAAHEVYDTLPAQEVWDTVMESTYDYAEPGFLLIDAINRMNPLNKVEMVRATNPCGEQPLPPYGACLLGSVNLTKFVHDPFTDDAWFDYDHFHKVVEIFTRMLDNVVEIHGLPLAEQQEELRTKRRHGMGYTGLGSAMRMIGIDYGSSAGVQFTEEVTKALVITGWEASAALAKEKGIAPIFEDKQVFEDFLESEYMQRIKEEDEKVWKKLKRNGSRFTHHSSIAPAGTISLALCDNVSNGIEPSFAHKYSRNVIMEGQKTKQKMDVYSYEFLVYQEVTGETEVPEDWETAESIDPYAHIRVQAAAQKWIDSSISKTINVATDYDFEDFKDLYMYAYKNGLKGCTTFRFNPEAFQGVLVQDKDLENTDYTFTLSDGNQVKCKGNDVIKYDGEEHTAANLYDALKEGYYGKF